MPSTYSPLKIELPATGEQSGTWGNTTNTNLGTALEEAIVGSADVTFASGNVTLTLTDTNASQPARNLRLNLIGVTGGSTRTLTVPAIEKLYLVSNNCADAIVVGNATGATVTVPAGNNIFVYNDGTDVLNAITYITALNAATVAAGSVTTTQVDIVSQGDLRLQDTTGGQFVALQAPGTIASSYTLTLPVDDGTSGQALITDGNGVLSWSTEASGDVYGPASATDNAIARFDLTTGKIIQNSVVTIADTTGNMAGVGTLSSGAITTTGVLTVPAGTVSAPAITTTGDTNTGIFFPAADTIAFTEGGGEAMRISSAGNVGIGTSSPAAKLQVAGGDILVSTVGNKVNFATTSSSSVNYVGGSADGFSLEMACQRGASQPFVYKQDFGSGHIWSIGGTERMRIDLSGNVGIGVTSLAAFGTGRGVQIATSATSQASSLYLQNGTTGTTGSDGLLLQMGSDNTTGYLWNFETGALAFATANAERMRIDSSGNVGIGTSSPNIYSTGDATNILGIQASGTNKNGLIAVAGTGTGYGGIEFGNATIRRSGIYTLDGSALAFYTNGTNSGTGLSERMRITSAGNVGIGTSSPANRLDVESSTTTAQIRSTSTTAGNFPRLVFNHAGNDSFGIGGGDGLRFLSSNTTERMRIDSSGNVGIGTSSPATLLTVSGAGSTGLLTLNRTDGSGFININSSNGVAGAQIGSTGAQGLQFYTNFSTSPLLAMQILSSGNVGIGTSSPDTRLDVTGTFNASSSATFGGLVRLANNREFQITDSTGTNQNVLFMFTDNSVYLSSPAASSSMVFRGVGYAERMRIDSSGNVGIGTSSPVEKLTVSGAISLNTDLVLKEGTTARGFLFGTSSGVFYRATSGLPHVFQNVGTELMRIDSSGNLLVNRTSQIAAEQFGVGFDGAAKQGIYITDTSSAATVTMMGFYKAGAARGSITSTSTATSYVTSSDYRLKENIAPMTGALATVSALKPVTYKWKADGSDGQGFIAHELQAVIPDCVTGEKDAVDKDGKIMPQGIDTSFLVATLTAAIQELKATVDAQAARIAALESK